MARRTSVDEPGKDTRVGGFTPLPRREPRGALIRPSWVGPGEERPHRRAGCNGAPRSLCRPSVPGDCPVSVESPNFRTWFPMVLPAGRRRPDERFNEAGRAPVTPCPGGVAAPDLPLSVPRRRLAPCESEPTSIYPTRSPRPPPGRPRWCSSSSAIRRAGRSRCPARTPTRCGRASWTSSSTRRTGSTWPRSTTASASRAASCCSATRPAPKTVGAKGLIVHGGHVERR